MARVWDRTPAFTADAGQFTFGADFTTDAPINVQGVLWWRTEDGPDEVTAYLWAAEGSSQLAAGTSSNLSLGWNLIPFDEPYAASPGLFAIAVEIDNEHGYDASGLPVLSPDGHVEIIQGRYESGHVGYPAANTWSGLHGIDLAYELPAAEITGTLTISLPVLSSTGDGGVTAAGALAGILPAAVSGITGSATTGGGLTATLPVLTGQSTGSAVTTASLDGVLPALGAEFAEAATSPPIGFPAGETVTRIRAPLVTDRYGNEVRDWDHATRLDILGCGIAPRTTDEETELGRQGVIVGIAVYAPPGTDIQPSDRMEVRGE